MSSGSSQFEGIPAFCLTYCQENCIENTLAYEFNASLIFSVMTVVVSAYHIYMHLHNFNNPFFQSKIIGRNQNSHSHHGAFLLLHLLGFLRIPGIFLETQDLEIYFTLTRDSYEALLLFVFFYLMFSYLAYDRDLDLMEDKKVYKIMIEAEKEVHHFWPIYYCQKPYQLTHWKKAKYFTYRCKKYVLQFLVVKLFTTLLMYIIYPNQTRHAGQQNFVQEDHQTYLIISSCVSWLVGISATYSLYYLVLFYHALHKPLAPYSALLKFLTIKVTIFFTFWQRIVIVLFQEDFLSCFDQSAKSYNQREIVTSLENTLICFQMLAMAIAGGIAYDYENYVSMRANNEGNFGYVIKDTIRAFKNDFRLIKPKKFGFATETRVTEIELQDIRLAARQSVAVSIKNNKPVEDSMIIDYL